MKKYMAIVSLRMFLVPAGIIGFGVLPWRMDAAAGEIRYPFYKSTQTMDTARDMIFDLGWEHCSEGGTRDGVVFKASDRNGKMVTLDFDCRIVGNCVSVKTEAGAEYAAPEITKELARRLGLPVEGAPLPEAPDSMNHTV